LNKRIAWGTMLTVILVSMLALTISIHITNAIYNPVADFVPPPGVDGREIAYIAKAFGSYPGHPRWNATLDIAPTVPDGRIDGRDLTLVAKSFGSLP